MIGSALTEKGGMAMADRENVVGHLYDCLAVSKPENTWVFVRKDIVGDALSMLKEQKALPIAYQDNPYTGLPVAHCPKCGKFARQYHAVYEEETKFCPYCGQEVKWNG